MRTLTLGVAGTLGLLGCALVYQIEGVSNSNVFRPPPPTASFTLQQAAGDPVLGTKIERMLGSILTQKGLRPTTVNPDLRIIYAFDVVPAGEVSTARTYVRQAPQTATVTTTPTGGYVTTSGGTTTARTVVDTTRLYDKTIAVLMIDARTGEKVWEGQTSETGWCNQIFVTAPHIFSLMFDRFPAEATNVRRMVKKSDPMARNVQALFPPDTNWGCR